VLTWWQTGLVADLCEEKRRQSGEGCWFQNDCVSHRQGGAHLSKKHFVQLTEIRDLMKLQIDNNTYGEESLPEGCLVLDNMQKKSEKESTLKSGIQKIGSVV